MAFLHYVHRLPPDLTSSIFHKLLQLPVLSHLLCFKTPEISITSLGRYRLRNPIGICAGIDKNGDMLRALLRLDLGFVTIGSATLYPREGNPRPRVVRVLDDLGAFKEYTRGLGHRAVGLVNSLGLPSRGILYVKMKINSVAKMRNRKTVLILSLAGFSLDEFVKLVMLSNDVSVEFIELNLSCPNVKSSAEWYRPEQLKLLLEEVSHCSKKDILVKLPPLSSRFAADELREVVRICRRFNVGIVVANTLRVRESRLSTGYGGLSGLPIYCIVKHMVRIIRKLDREIPLIAVGGVYRGWQVHELLRLGANAVGIVSAFANEGPLAVRRIARELIDLLRGSTRSLARSETPRPQVRDAFRSTRTTV